MDTSNWYIVGHGAIGSLLLAGFVKNELPITTIGRENKRLNFQVQDFNKRLLDISAPVITSDDLENRPTPSVILLPIKAYQIRPAIKQLKSYLDKNTVIILMHNGMGTLDTVARLLPENTILCATTTHGVFKKSDELVVHAGNGSSQIGLGHNDLPEIKQNEITAILDKSLPTFSWQQDIQALLWRKLAVNAVINPLTAIYQCKNGYLLESKFDQQRKALYQEISQIAQANHIDLPVDEIENLVETVCRETADNYSSMNRDVAAKRATEIDYINGFLVQQAQLTNQNCNLNQNLIETIKRQTTT